MRLNWYRSRLIEKPIRGFGWRGWLATAVFFGILIPHLAGYDWQFFVLETIWRIVGIDPLIWFVHQLLPISYNLFEPYFSLTAVLGMWIAMRVAPVRFGWWRYALLLAASIVGSYLFYWSIKLGILDVSQGPNSNFGPLWIWPAMSLSFGGFASWIATGSKRVGLAWIVVIPIAIVRTELNQPILPIPTAAWFGGIFDTDLLSVLTQGIPCGIAVWWAVRLRALLHVEGLCKSCGYTLEGNTTGICPECGEAIEEGVREEAPVAPSP